MKTLAYNEWLEANQQYLHAAIVGLYQYLEHQIQDKTPVGKETEQGPAAQMGRLLPDCEMNPPATLQTLCSAFSLSDFERDILLLCVGVELDSRFASLVAAIQGEARSASPTFGLALSLLPNAHWSALTPEAPLRWWRMLELGMGNSLSNSPLSLDERVLHYLTGVPQMDARLTGLTRQVPLVPEIPASHHGIVERMMLAWSGEKEREQGLVIQLNAKYPGDTRAIAAQACHRAGMTLFSIEARDIPANVTERDALARLWEREAVLANVILLVECDDAAHAANVISFASGISVAILLSSREPLPLHRLNTLLVDVPQASTTEQVTLWRQALGAPADRLNGQLQNMVSQFNLGAEAIYAASTQALEYETQIDDDGMATHLWNICRTSSRQRLDELAQRIEPVATWDDLVLPEAQLEILRHIVAHVRQRARVYDSWGFRAKSARGLGISALFTGSSGTGKTMASEVLANELKLDLYRIDLSQVVSKYIGETEKNLRRVFDVAERGGAVLLFDEADALFGKRSEVKDSHDRHANIEVSYLLQRMEEYSGLAILTTNMKKALDKAFLRRIRFFVQFPFPDIKQRTEIWRCIFPADTPVKGLQLEQLAQLNVAGGNIRNVALNAAFLAADANEPVGMAHVLQAVRDEYAKLEKPLSNSETKGWV
jgi:ATP-dependent 26S proteasome regulatory subunit